jgi:hypothetical protein
MARSAQPDHDQRLKVLLKEFFRQFFDCFFPTWAQRFDFEQIDWLDKEVFLAPPQGEKRELDLVARLHLLPDAPPVRQGEKDLVALVHLELEARDSSLVLRPRMFDYYVQLRRDLGLPVLPIGVFLRVGLDGIGWDAYEEHFWEHRLLCFEYAYVGLPALDGAQYAVGDNLLGVALCTRMKVSPERKLELYAEALKRVALAKENDYRRFLLAECLEAYADLDEGQKERLQQVLSSEQYREVRPMMTTTFERGLSEGLSQGILQGERASTLRLLEAKFGTLSPDVKSRVEALLPEELHQVQIKLLKARSLKKLGLVD